MSRILRSSLILPVALALAGCGSASLSAVTRPTTGPQAATRIAPAKAEKAGGDDVKALGTWSGRIGTRAARVWVPYAGAVEAEMDGARFSGSLWGSAFNGSLRRDGRPTASVSMSIFGAMIDGRVGGRAVRASFAQGGWLTGRVGDDRLSLSVLPNGISGQMGPHAVWMSGFWYQQGEEWPLAVGLLALMGGL
ncbi:MAG: hypothetical protein VKS61_18590 [Candidatus Sericytochromatia bacterium]|nr:hypothetical protein [Candidatus Sericytochromatia bacterium]